MIEETIFQQCLYKFFLTQCLRMVFCNWCFYFPFLWIMKFAYVLPRFRINCYYSFIMLFFENILLNIILNDVMIVNIKYETPNTLCIRIHHGYESKPCSSIGDLWTFNCCDKIYRITTVSGLSDRLI